jgi:hypothetical protein
VGVLAHSAPVLRGEPATFDGVRVMLAIAPDGDAFVCLEGVKQAVSDLSYVDHGRLHTGSHLANVDIHGQVLRMLVIDKRTFLGFALAAPGFDRFKAWAVRKLEELETTGVALAGDYDNDPVIILAKQQLLNIAEARKAQLDAERALRNSVEAIQKAAAALEQSQEAKDQADSARAIAQKIDGRLSMLEIANLASVSLNEDQSKNEGMYLANWSREHGDDPRLARRKDVRYPNGVNTYTHEAAKHWHASRAPIYRRHR